MFDLIQKFKVGFSRIWSDSPEGGASPLSDGSPGSAGNLERKTDTGGNRRHTVARVTQTGGIAIGIVSGADGSRDPGFEDGWDFGNFVNFRTPSPFPLTGILVAYWLLFVSHPILPTNITNDDFNIPEGWPHHATDFFAHWNLNRNAAWSFDTWLLNLFPRNRPFVGYLGGYNTLNFIPTLGNMILGLIAGTWLREDTTGTILKRLLLAGLACMALAWGLEIAGICPIIKKIWTPAWTLYSGGWTFLFMAVFYYIMDVKKLRAWAFPFVVIGMNSIAMYLLFHTIDAFIAETLEQHLTPRAFLLLGPDLQPILLGSAVLLTLWLILLWMYRRKIYLRV